MKRAAHVLLLASGLWVACQASDRAAQHGALDASSQRADGGLHPRDASAQRRDGSAGELAGDTGDPSAPDPFADAGPPAICPASDLGNHALGQDMYKGARTAITALTYTNVGGAGAYPQVVSGWSKATGCQGDPQGQLCKTVYRKEKQVDAALAPFDEDMSLVFAGPIELYQIAVYQPDASGWKRAAYWDRCVSDGLVFAGNKSWYECAGFVESYVSADGTHESATPVQFSGSLAAGAEVNVMSSARCEPSDPSCGWSSGLPLRGFGGDAAGSKLFAVKLRMPIGDHTPAYWILPGQVIRSSQYGCNCRGQGSDPVYKGGCGELDVAEILGGVNDSLEATTTLYSFQGITGGGDVTFARPVQESATFLVIFDAPSQRIAIRRLGAGAFDFAGRLGAAQVSHWLDDQGVVRALSTAP